MRADAIGRLLAVALVVFAIVWRGTVTQRTVLDHLTQAAYVTAGGMETMSQPRIRGRDASERKAQNAW